MDNSILTAKIKPKRLQPLYLLHNVSITNYELLTDFSQQSPGFPSLIAAKILAVTLCNLQRAAILAVTGMWLVPVPGAEI